MTKRACGVLLALLLAGCAEWNLAPEDRARTQSDRLQAHYPDLANGRFAIVADFETEEHRQLFRGESEAAVSFERRGGVRETGAACVRVSLARPSAQLVIDNTAAETWLLKRDWSGYDLLLANVFSPVAGVQLDLTIVSGDDAQAAEGHSLIPLRTGWNLLRLDLEEASDYIALDDVRQVRFGIPGAKSPVELRIDDIVLTDNTEAVFGAPTSAAGRLYVLRKGRQIRVGAVDRFELGFANGQIVRWFALDTDPLRLKDLVGPGNALGPLPVVLPDDDPAAAGERWPIGFEALGDMVATRQRVIEASDVRVVVECVWTFARGAKVLPEDAPQLRWRYAIYPTGHLYATVQCATRHEDFAPVHIGLTVNRLPLTDLVFEIHEPAQLRDPPALRHTCYGWSATSDGDAGLLFVLHDSRQGPRLRLLPPTDRPRTGFLACGGEVASPTNRWHCLLEVWGPGPDRAARRADVASAYTRPAPLEFSVGGLDLAAQGDADADGWIEGVGAYALAPDAARVQFKIDGKAAPGIAPAFVVQESAGREAWVYVDYVIHEPLGRDLDGNVVFQLEGPIDKPMLVEVYLRNPPQTP